MTSVTTVREGIYLVEAPLDGALTVRGAAVVGGAGALVWDTLTGPRAMAPLLPLLAGRPLTVVYSHADWDHIWGTAAFPGARVVGHRRCRERFDQDVPATLAEYRSLRPGEYDAVVLVPPAEVFDAALDIDLGDLAVELRHLPGHTPDCIVAFIPAWGVLLAGDTVETPLPYVTDGGAIGPWAAALEAWAADPRVRTVIPCHGHDGGPELLRATAAYLRGLADGSSPLPPDLDESYREVHTANMKIVRG